VRRISLLIFHHVTNFCAKKLIDAKIIANNRNSRWRPSAILGFRNMISYAVDFPSGYQIWFKMLIDARIMAQKRNSACRPPPSWICFRLLFLTHCRFYTHVHNHHTKFRANISICDWIIINFWNSRWRPSALLDFRKSDFWPAMGRLTLIADFPSPYPIWCKNVDRRPYYGPKTKFKMASAAILN